MKKIVKSSLIAILLVAVAIAITGCGAKKDKTYNTLGKTLLGDTYIIELEGDNLSGTDEKGTLTIAKKNGNVLQEVKSGEEKMSIMFKDNTTYLVAHDQKIYMKTEGRDESILPEEDETFLSKDELEALKTQEYKTGKESIDGKEYDYEENYDSENEITERYYFDGNELKYVKSIDSDGEEQIMKVLKLSSEVDDSVFDIPSDYKLIEE